MENRMIGWLTRVFTAARMRHRQGTRTHRVISYITWSSMLVALLGSSLSAAGICTGACIDAETYRMFGVPFATVGVPFFLIVAASSLGRNSKYASLRTLYDVLLPGAAGAEWIFYGIQKNVIRHYCPVCLAIGVAVLVAALLRLVELYLRSRGGIFTPIRALKGVFRSAIKGVLIFASMYTGLLIALIGVSSPALAGYAPITQNIWFGKTDSNVEVLIVSDWFCMYCRKAEPAIEKMLPAIGKVARYSFIDDPIHKGSLAFIPANMSLLVNAKPQYLEGRKVLLDLSAQDKTPSKVEIVDTLKKNGINLTFLAAPVIEQLTRTEAGFLRANSIMLTPTIVVRNRRTGVHRALVGTEEITNVKVADLIKDIGK